MSWPILICRPRRPRALPGCSANGTRIDILPGPSLLAGGTSGRGLLDPPGLRGDRNGGRSRRRSRAYKIGLTTPIMQQLCGVAEADLRRDLRPARCITVAPNSMSRELLPAFGIETEIAVRGYGGGSAARGRPRAGRRRGLKRLHDGRSELLEDLRHAYYKAPQRRGDGRRQCLERRDRRRSAGSPIGAGSTLRAA